LREILGRVDSMAIAAEHWGGVYYESNVELVDKLEALQREGVRLAAPAATPDCAAKFGAEVASRRG